MPALSIFREGLSCDSGLFLIHGDNTNGQLGYEFIELRTDIETNCDHASLNKASCGNGRVALTFQYLPKGASFRFPTQDGD